MTLIGQPHNLCVVWISRFAA